MLKFFLEKMPSGKSYSLNLKKKKKVPWWAGLHFLSPEAQTNFLEEEASSSIQQMPIYHSQSRNLACSSTIDRRNHH